MAEFSIIDRYFKTQASSDIALGIGDDSAVLTPPPHQQLVICTDTLIAGRHFPIDTSPHAIGWKSVAVNLSDIAAMGAKPHSILLALSCPYADADWLEAFSQGLFDCCKPHNVQLIGGDTTQSPHLTITVTALGWIDHQQAVTRSGAKVGDYVVVSGQIGDAAFGLQHLDHPLKQRLDYPIPRCELGEQLKSYASSMIDISDGLAQDLGHILKASNVGAVLDIDRLPTDPILKQLPEQQRYQYALAGGDDYELCFTISPTNYQNLITQSLSIPITVIGEVTANSGLLFKKNNKNIHLNLNGYQHFA